MDKYNKKVNSHHISRHAPNSAYRRYCHTSIHPL